MKLSRLYRNLLLLAIGMALGGGYTYLDKPKVSANRGYMGSDLKDKLSPLQFEVTQKNGTEPPFKNEFWNHKEPGIYVDIVSGEPLFSSTQKFDSGCGWPSFSETLAKENIELKEDSSHGMHRIEVRSKNANSHLGHLFDDGPAPTRKRYCINSASLRFVPVDKMEAEGYGKYLSLFPDYKKKGSSKVTDPKNFETAILAGGCFWGVEELIRKLPGVVKTEVGYTGGKTKNPTYPDLKTGTTGHAEAIKVIFDRTQLKYEDLLAYFFRLHDPTTKNRQGNDVGTQYRSAIFYTSKDQRDVAQKVKEKVDKSGKWKAPVVTELVEASEFYSAEEYHQDYLQKNPGGYTCHFLRD